MQDAILRSLQRLDEFDPRHEEALESYLRQAIRNRIRDEILLAPVDSQNTPDGVK